MDNCIFKCVPKDKWIINLSERYIPNHVLHIARLGKKFGVPYMKTNEIPLAQIIAAIELEVTNMEEEEKIKTRSSYMHAINNYLQKRRQLDDNVLRYKLRVAKRFMKKNKDIIFLKADKGNTTVIVTKNFYLDKMMSNLKDEKTYKILKYNPTKILKYEVYQLLKNWNEDAFIDEATKHHLSGMNGSIARAYGLPKIHKPDIPFRIIVSFINSPTYRLAKYLQQILNRSLNLEFNQPRGSKIFIKNSRSLMENIRQLQLPEEFVMISMDVVSLFTNIPLKLVVKGIESRWNIIKHHTGIPMKQFIEAIKLCFNSSAFVFNGEFYQQVYGAAMGSPLSPIVAEIVMQDLENFCLSELDFPVYFYTRYVDDILVFLPPNEVEKILDIFNKYHDRLKFTIEREVDKKINFLELTLIRSSNKIEFDWYQKPTATGRYLNYYSHHPKYQKLGIIKLLIDKAVLLCDPRFRNKNLGIIRESLFNNGYPKNMATGSLVLKLFAKKIKVKSEIKEGDSLPHH
ncbi:uncharacterized protein [Chelonus insularis]|uniref:uncharacterized protein n=1 Tax=Chelonus insularis TaxID=460826 RepID=UPI00158B1BB9|nr:uncharacterized protein LOC118073987 [Chelonus insularis]